MKTYELLLILLILVLGLSLPLFMFFIGSEKEIEPLVVIIEKEEDPFNSCLKLDGVESSECIANLDICTDDECKNLKARLTKDENLCFNISDETMRVGCTAQVTQTKIIQGAVLENNLSKCALFEDRNAISSCEDNYWFISSLKSNDKSLCLNILREEVKNECQES